MWQVRKKVKINLETKRETMRKEKTAKGGRGGEMEAIREAG